MDWIFWTFLVAGLVHIMEEFGYPGGFLDMVRRLNPRFAPSATVGFVVAINALFLLLCIAGAVVGERSLIVSLSVASLLFFNALMHIGGTIRARGYAPGLISGVLLYLTLSLLRSIFSLPPVV